MARHRFTHTTPQDIEAMARRRCQRCAQKLGMLGRNRYTHADGKICDAITLRMQFDQRNERHETSRSLDKSNS